MNTGKKQFISLANIEAIKGMACRFCMLLLALFLWMQAFSQPSVHTVAGKVVDEGGKPMSNVTVWSKGLSSILSKADGTFEMKNVPDNALMRFSHVGYETREITIVAGKYNVGVVMKEIASTLAEVVVNVGLYKRPVATFTGASSTITGAELKMINPTNVIQALVAAEPALRIVENNELGSDPNSLPVIQLRGANNLPIGVSGTQSGETNRAVYEGDIMSAYLANPNQPLLILDGFPTTLQRLNDMDINLIERITVLKDAAATAAYGSRAANGVIVIETKQPAGGQLRLNYSINLFTQIADLSSYDMMNATQLLEAQRLRGVYNSASNYSDAGLKQWYDYRYRNVLAGVNTYWLSQPVRNGFGTMHSLSLNGGNGNKVRYSLGLGYNNNVGVMKESNRENFNLTTNISYVGRNLKVTNAIVISRNRSNNTSWGTYGSYVQQFPFYKMTDSLGNILKILEPGAGQLGFLEGAPGGVQANVMYNSTLNVKDYSIYLGFTNNLQLDFTVSKSFHLRGSLGVNSQLASSEKYFPADHSSFVSSGSSNIGNLGSYNTVEGNNSAFNGQLSADFNQRIKEHAFFISVGVSAGQSSSNSISRKVSGSPTDVVNDIGMLNGYGISTKPVSVYSEIRNLSNFISATYTYSNRYTLEGTLNQSGSSQFGANNRTAPFWAFGGSWVADKEKWFKQNGIISSLRFFANVGLTGNQNFGPYSYSVYQYNMTDDYRLQLGALVPSYSNPNLKWQQTKKYSFGTGMSLFKGKFNVRGSFFLDQTDNLILPLAVAPSTGFTSYSDNLGATESKGYELGFGANLIRNTQKNISWTLSFNTGRATTAIKSLSPAVEAINESFNTVGSDGKNQTKPLPRYKVGQSMTTIWAVQSLGIDPANGLEMFRKLDGSTTYIWDANDKMPIAEGNAIFRGAINNNINYKAFSINLVFSYQYGGYAYNQTLVDKVENVNISQSNASERVLNDRWKLPGDMVKFKALNDITITNATSRFVQKNDFIDATSISFAYTFSRNLAWVKKLRLSTPRIAITQNNIFRVGTIKMERGTGFPFARSFNFGLSTNF